MKEAVVQSIQKMIESKLSLYCDLRHCLNEERAALIQVNVENLWKISSRKDALCSKIALLRKDIAAVVSPWIDLNPFNLNDLLGVIPEDRIADMHRAGQAISCLKLEIDGLRKHNLIYINDSLRFLDDLMAIISTAAKPDTPQVYNRQCGFNQARATHFLSQEV